MKKVMSLIFVSLLLLSLSACVDKKYTDDSINVMYFTANANASTVDTVFGLETGALLTQPEDPTRAGYTFDAWYKDYFRTELWDFGSDVVGETSFILYAGWDAITFSIIYDPNGGTMPATYREDFITEDYFVLPIPYRTGYVFVAWYLYDWEDESSTIPGDPGFQTNPSNYTEDLYLYAHWEAASVAITFRSNYPIDGEGPANPLSLIAYYGDVIAFPMLDDTAEYTFIGWNAKSDGTGDWYVNGDILVRTQRITLYGVWEAK